jgi:hypothetical protein
LRQSWGPSSALFTHDGKQSPSTGLLHELGHAYGRIFERKDQRDRNASYLTGGWFNEEEKHVIQTYENPAALILQEGTRNSHKEGVPFHSIDPTSTIQAPTNEKPD